jgi:hypothetical protein
MNNIMRNSGETLVAVGTEHGGYIFERSRDGEWKRRGPFLKNESVNTIRFGAEGKLLAATFTEGVFESKDNGRTWRTRNRGLHVRKVWTIESDPHKRGRVYAGTHYGHLFVTDNEGEEWDEVTGLHNAPMRNEWGVDWAMGTTGLTIHTVRVDPKRKNRIFIVSSGAGTYRSDDGGGSWTLLRNGLQEKCPTFGSRTTPSKPVANANENLENHLSTVHTCTHKLAFGEDGAIFQQNHCGVFKSDNAGEFWADVSPQPSKRHGFPIVTAGYGRKEYLYTVPAYQGICKDHNSCVRGQLEVLRRDEGGGGGWSSHTKGLPIKTHTCVLRDAMGSPGKGSHEVFIGTTTGELFGTDDDGEKWVMMAKGLGRVQGVSAKAF